MVSSMAIVKFIQIRDGRCLGFGRSRDLAGAVTITANAEHWIASGIALSVANAMGRIDNVTTAAAEATEVIPEPTPTRRSAVLGR